MADDGWFSMMAALDDGRRVDLFQDGRPHPFERPADIVHMLRTARLANVCMYFWMEKHRQYLKL